MPPRPSATLPLLLLAAALALGWNLGGYRFLDPDEGRNGEVAREMMVSNDYLVPHLDGLPYLDKPIVYFAAAAATMEVLGPTETAARLPAYLFTLATIVLVVRFARRRWEAEAGPDIGWFAGVALATMPLVMAYAHTTIFDSTLAFCTTAAILAFREDRPVLAWAAIGLGAITKGPVAIGIPLFAMVPFALATGQPLRRLVTLPSLAVFAAVALPWFLAVSARLPDFPHYVFVRETVQRVTTKSFHRTAPFWFYLPIILFGAFPWIVPALAGLGRWRDSWRARTSDATARDSVFLACWVLGPLVFFTLNQSKLPQYVLPVMPALALAAARSIATRGVGLGWRIYATVAALLSLSLLTLMQWMPTAVRLTPAERIAIPPTALGLGGVLVLSAGLVWLAARRSLPVLGITGYALCVMSIPVLSGRLMEAVGEDRSAFALAGAVQTALPREGYVLGVSAYPPSLPFYLGHTVDVATATGRELTSNWIADQQERFRTLPGSPLKPGDHWREVLARCPQPTVFVTRTGDTAARETLAAGLALVAVEGRYAAYGPCRPAGQRP